MERCTSCGTIDNVKSYKRLPCFLGWYEIPEWEDYCDGCIKQIKEKNIQELKDSLLSSLNYKEGT
ncbi:hypothetical protein NDS46_30130 (plasmid) [Paenibacillus thiaminolyticus]|uniref:hypothetical protein n=1 Tax=Paenibacillus thiaminolyticus TaxID=49283 RepID=UPI00232B5E81|nr:hypothetical protein [Paenibacillus thiaminolyticus]WCF11606.1 hypothetical protein NDS46_30130 [Paenibacillus thiaminolyticus]